MLSLGLKMWRSSELISWYNLSWLVQRWTSSERAYFIPALWWKCFHQDLNFCPGHLYEYCYSHHHGHLANFGPDPASVAFTPYNYVLEPGKAMSVHTKYIDEALIRYTSNSFRSLLWRKLGSVLIDVCHRPACWFSRYLREEWFFVDS